MYLIQLLDLENRVMLAGEISSELIPSKMEWADIYLQPSIQEGFCNSVIEAQAMGLLCVVTNAEGLSENVIHGETGWVVDKRSPGSIANQIIKIMDMEIDTYREISKNAISRVSKNFQDIDHVIKWSKFYQ